MNHKFKAIGLAALAVLAIGAVSASVAQAAAKFTSESSPSYLKGEQETKAVFTTNGGTIKCSGAKLEGGPFKGTELTSLTLHPTYTGCTAFGAEATVETTGCNYDMDVPNPPPGEMPTIEIECAAGKAMRVTVPSAACSIGIYAQIPETPTVITTNKGSGKTSHLQLAQRLSGITYTSTGGICGSSGTNGTLTGEITVKAFTEAGFTVETGFEWVP